MLVNGAKHSEMIKTEAQRLGFMKCGIAAAQELTEDAYRLENWLTKNYQGKMGYMERNFDLRIDPRKLVPNAKSVITLLLNYYPQENQKADAPKIAKYAFGLDYHYVIREKINELIYFINQNIGNIAGRGFVDSAPVLERSWGLKSGLGWIGKNGNLINKKEGSFFFIATLICDLELAYDLPFMTDHCGTCTRCIEACPTEAIVNPTEIDGSKCISYLTIELKDELLPKDLQPKMEGWVFGCDICQDVCPWNRFSKPNTEIKFQPLSQVLNLSLSEWEEISESAFKNYFKQSPIARTKWRGMMRNIKAIKTLKN
jgi:epoxyqueuosine reductase